MKTSNLYKNKIKGQMMLFKFPLISACLLLFSSFIFMPPVGFSQEQKKVYTLEESIAEAMANNWALNARKENIHQAALAEKQARAEFLPKFSMTYGYTRLDEAYKTDPVPLGGGLEIPAGEINTTDNYQLKGTVTQPIFTGFALTSSHELAKLGIYQSEIEFELEKVDLALKVKETYFGILEADKFLEVTRKAVESLESHIRVARIYYEVGMIPINDLLKAEVELANAQHDLIKARNASLLARSAFNMVLSRPINAEIDVKDILVHEPVKVDFQAHLEKALKNRPEINLLDISISQAKQGIILAKSKKYPELALIGNYIKEGDTPDVSGSKFHDSSHWQAMALLSWTFWDWGKTRYSVREKQSSRMELLKTMKALEDSIRLELKESVLSLKEAERSIPTARKAIEQAEENLRVSQERYKAQVTTSTEVLDAQTLLTQARTNYYSALYGHNLAKARLKRALGTY